MMPVEDIPADVADLIRVGVVTAVDWPAARVVVRYGDPDDADGAAETPPIRWLAPRAGAVRIWSPPTVGEQVLILCPDGQLGAAVAVGGLFYNDAPPPAASDIAHIEFADGATIIYDPAAHALSATLPGGGTASIDAPAGVTITGPVSIIGDVTVTGTVDATGDVTGDGISLSGHRHGGVKSGGELTAPPQ